MRDKVPRTRQKLIERVTNMLGHRPRTEGTKTENITKTYELPPEYKLECQTHYTLGRRYGVDAKCNIKKFGKPQGTRRSTGYRKIKWIIGIKCCFLCHREGHMVSQRHTKQEVKEAKRKLKAKQATELLTEVYLAYITKLFDDE